MCWISRWPLPIQYVQLHVLLALGTIWILVLLLVIGRKKAMGVTIFLAAVFFNLLFICSSKWVAHNVKIYIHACICILAWKFTVWHKCICTYIHTYVYTVKSYQEIRKIMGFTNIIHFLWCHHYCNTLGNFSFGLCFVQCTHIIRINDYCVSYRTVLTIILFGIRGCASGFFLSVGLYTPEVSELMLIVIIL